jgi:hypothetical protein
LANEVETTDVRCALLESLREEHGPFPWEELHRKIGRKSCDPATRYRTLVVFQRGGSSAAATSVTVPFGMSFSSREARTTTSFAFPLGKWRASTTARSFRSKKGCATPPAIAMGRALWGFPRVPALCFRGLLRRRTW